MIRTWFFWLLGLFPHILIKREGGRPYLTRYCLLGGSPYTTAHPWLPFNLFLHCFHASDEHTPHNHPWRWSRSLILSGSYREHRLLNANSLAFVGAYRAIWLDQTFNPGSWNRLDDQTFHWVELQTPKVWTLFLCGKKVQQWGFYTPERGFKTARDYLAGKVGATSNMRIIDG